MVGSQAHGLATPESDFDYRGVFIYPTSELMQLHPPADQTSWIEGHEDDTSFELSKFLLMATKCNPTVLECFKAKRVDDNDWYLGYLGDEIQALFPYVWNSTDVKNAYIGYGVNQRKKFLENKDKRQSKYAVAYLRSLFNAWQILETGTFSSDMTGTDVFLTLKRWKAGQFTLGEVIDTTAHWTEMVDKAYAKNPNKKTDEGPVNDFLLKVRKENWE